MTRPGPGLTLDEYAADFSEEPGYLDYAFVGPVGRAVVEEETAMRHLVEHVRHGALAPLFEQSARVRAAVGELTGFRPDQVTFQAGTSLGLMHSMFGVTGGVAVSSAEFPAVTFAVQRAADALGVVVPRWIDTEHGRVTPGELRSQLDGSVVAVAVSLVDFRTGYLADLDGIRQVIGDRLLIVDAAQGFGVVDAVWEVADVIAAGGQKWPRAGWGTGFLALSDRAVERLTPVWSGFVGTEADGLPMDEVLPPSRAATAFQVSEADPVAQARLAVALERIADVGVAPIADRIGERIERVIALADEYAVPVASPRAQAERAGIVVLEPAPDQLTALVASLHNAGVTATARAGTVRLSAHVSTGDDTLDLLRSALVAYARATAP